MNLENFMKDAMGRLVPIDLVKPVDKLRDELVKKIVVDALGMRESLKQFRESKFDEINAFVELSASEHDVKWGGRKGNLSLTSYDGCCKVEVQISARITFSEKLQIAKELIDEYLRDLVEGSGEEVKLIVYDAFQVDSEGRISTSRILSLRRIQINDRRWLKAMDAIADAIVPQGSKEYIRIYQRPDAQSKWQPISLSLAAV